jgi:hypothetical protein
MKRIINPSFSGRSSSPFFVCYRFVSSKSNEKYRGIKEKFDENQARLYFDKWIKSLW